uniref:Uncharacterized protein n=1 Tax=Anguilla anguilla TaxID=7936 RepID=A0A0E9VTB4_ANGAN
MIDHAAICVTGDYSTIYSAFPCFVAAEPFDVHPAMMR